MASAATAAATIAAAEVEQLPKDPEAFDRQAERRRRSWAHGSRPERGHAPGTEAALRKVHGLTLLCRREGCGALVHWRSARAQARRQGSMQAGDGCAGSACAARFRRCDFVKRQCAMAVQLLVGERRLCVWPRSVGDVDIWACTNDSGAAEVVGRAVLRGHGASTHGRMLRARDRDASR